MSKMRMPEMDVVRFQESDVIVASNLIKLVQYGDGTNGNGYVSYKGGSYGNNQQAGNLDTFYTLFNKDHGTSIDGTTSIGFEREAGSGYTDFNGLNYLDNLAAESPVDGDYIWTGSMFERRQ